MFASSARIRGDWARKGLASRARLHRSTQSQLLRQLYLAHYEQRRFRQAFGIAEQMIELGDMPDVAHQDAARALHACGDIDGAVGHYRIAARRGPASRRAFHCWTLGSVLFLEGRHDEAISALERAKRWATSDKPLYEAHIVLVRCSRGEVPSGVLGTLARLAQVPAGQGYGRFVLGMLSVHAGRYADARRFLESFVRRTREGRATVAIALEGELGLAKRTLSLLEK